MDQVAFLLNGDPVRVDIHSPSVTLLDWLRENRGLCGTKEGCNEGDCGACTVMISDDRGSRSVNACILMLPQIHGKAIRTVEGISNPNGELHPVQEAMVDHHGSQCGFCTPGFVVSMATAHKNGATDFDTQLAGNLCRCTGYAPIIRAAEAAADADVPAWLDDREALASMAITAPDAPYRPTDLDAFSDWYLENPDAVLVAGATDVGLWVTKRLVDLQSVAFLSGLDALRTLDVSDDSISVGAGATVNELEELVDAHHPSLAAMLRRFGSNQVRNSGTVGGNIANGSPIGDLPPALIALNARLTLRRGSARREVAIEDFFISYGKQDRAPGEFVESFTIPRQEDRLACYKLSKRFDQDISALCGCFSVRVSDGHVTDARIAFGGMAGTPHRAKSVEGALVGQPWTRATIDLAKREFSNDFQPMSDMRASANYRMDAAQNMMVRYYQEDQGENISVLEVSA